MNLKPLELIPSLLLRKDNTKLSIIIKKVEKGYGTNIIFNDLKVGDIVELEGPMGDELIVDNSAKKYYSLETE